MRLVVIGGVAAGLSAAARARRLDPSLEIIVLERGRHVSWAACGLPYFIEGQVRSVEQLTVYTAEYLSRERNIQVRTETEATAISHGRREVALRGGERIRYDKLVIATGASPDQGALEPGERVFTLTTLEETERLGRWLSERRPRTAAVVGAGYIGLEAATALRARGLRVTIFEAAPEVLGREDPELTEWTRKHLERFGVELRLRTRVPEVGGFDLVVLGSGVKPNSGLAMEAGIEIGRTGAIRVTERMETNLTSVYAAGDCAETTHLVTGAPAYIPLGTTANKMGRVAGANAAGRRERFPGVTGTSLVRVCGIAIGLSGLSIAQARRAGFEPVSARIEHADKASYFRGRPCAVELVADRRTRRLLGGAVVGENEVAGRVNTIAAALTARLTVDAFEHLDLAYAPPYSPVWDPLLIAAQQLMKLLD
ncbi:MAG: FAD-dependent oxidoreductase [Acidobacteria bacterium]|nr:FAD-dependent oxidoreductase [Acidobacteriota bacterium]